MNFSKTDRGRLLSAMILSLLAATVVDAAHFTARATSPLDEAYGVSSFARRFASDLPQDATGTIELCYAENGEQERILGRVEVRPFRSSEATTPDLRILFTKAKVNGRNMIVILIGYGIRSGAFVVDVPELANRYLSGSGMPVANPSGEFNLLGFGDAGVTIKGSGEMEGIRGRLFFRYVDR